ncbi:AraC family transcriptional regulator [Paenibacillus vini]|uniref:AraC family transcriptional regulator n=1 Tax=Paenibacillus vini TaxID=1476024 RepID=UPI0025B729DA|nr:AraC family transcriptional regulator [Paenibacillus vini]MDN4069647.1 AraC family transcriptional regulator [Paenibacillus vini]
MTKFMDYMISPHPIRVFNPAVEATRLKIKSISVVGAGHLPGRTLQRASAVFQQWAFVVITGGAGYYQVNRGERQRVEAGSWFCLFPGTEFNYGPDAGGYWDEYYFTVEGERVGEWLRDWLLSPDQVKRVSVDDTLLHKMELMFMLIDSGVPGNLDRAALQLESLLYELVSWEDKTEAGNRGGFVLQVIEDIGRSLYLPLDAVDIAARHHISVSTLRRVIHEYSGYPLNEFIHRLKAAEAKNILLNTEMSVKEISEMLGYKDMFYFSRVFKRITGVSPRDYRSRVGT